MRQKKKKIFPPTIFFMLAVVSIILCLILPDMRVIIFPFNLIGVIPILFGIILNIWTDEYFKIYDTTVKPDEVPSSLIKSGPFAISRHPMYLGMIMILFGESILLGSLVTFVIPIVFFLFIELFFIPLEEKNLLYCFKDDYLSYKKKVRRWI